jgi:hypothetical protein
LLAPACSSFDQFDNFEHRGRVFKEIVERLAGEASREDNNRVAQRARAVDHPTVETPGEPAVLPADPPLKDKSKELLARRKTPRDKDVPVPSEPEPSVLTAPRELEYVFEVSAEESATQGLRDSEEAADDFVLDEEDLTNVETVDNEAFAYEVRTGTATGGGSANARKETPMKINRGERSRVRKEK